MRILAPDRGLLVASTLLGIWLTSLVILLSLDLTQIAIHWQVLAFFWQTFLFTGLFITAHDAMHGVVCPRHPRLNDAIGALCLRLYALFSFKFLREKHWQHHHYPASVFDPDFHTGTHPSRPPHFWAWYLQFMTYYWSWWRLFALMAIFNVANLLFLIPEDNLKYFWVFPSVLSSLQLFFFGTYLPHRRPRQGYTNSHRAQTTALPVFWSFVTCYHFGYHEEHHTLPQVPWWGLPAAHRHLTQHQSVQQPN